MFFKNSALYVFFLCVFSTPTSSFAQKNTTFLSPTMHSFSRTIHDLKQRKSLSTYRLIVIPTIIALIIYFNKNSIARSMQDSPIASLAASCFLSNYLIDTYAKYQNLSQALDLFIFSQTINHYILCMITIRNEMKQQNELKNTSFNEDDFYNIIKTQTGHSLQDLEKLSQELTNGSVHSINGLCANISTTDLDETLYFFSQDKITPEEMLSLVKHDQNLSNALLLFYKNPEKEYKNTLTLFCTLLKQHLRHIL